MTLCVILCVILCVNVCVCVRATIATVSATLRAFARSQRASDASTSSSSPEAHCTATAHGHRKQQQRQGKERVAITGTAPRLGRSQTAATGCAPRTKSFAFQRSASCMTSTEANDLVALFDASLGVAGRSTHAPHKEQTPTTTSAVAATKKRPTAVPARCTLHTSRGEDMAVMDAVDGNKGFRSRGEIRDSEARDAEESQLSESVAKLNISSEQEEEQEEEEQKEEQEEEQEEGQEEEEQEEEEQEEEVVVVEKQDVEEEIVSTKEEDEATEDEATEDEEEDTESKDKAEETDKEEPSKMTAVIAESLQEEAHPQHVPSATHTATARDAAADEEEHEQQPQGEAEENGAAVSDSESNEAMQTTAAGGSDTAASGLREILALCGQHRPCSFADAFGGQWGLDACVKVGEGSYGEVFALTPKMLQQHLRRPEGATRSSSSNSSSSSSGSGGDDDDVGAAWCAAAARDGVAFKLMPIDGCVEVNGALPKRCAEVAPEIACTQLLSAVSHGLSIAPAAKQRQKGQEEEEEGVALMLPTFIRTHSLCVCQGAMPHALLQQWDRFLEKDGVVLMSEVCM